MTTARKRAIRLPALPPAEEVQLLVRSIAADPAKTQWLRNHVANALEAAAQEVSGIDLLAVAPEQILARRAAAHRRGDTPLW